MKDPVMHGFLLKDEEGESVNVCVIASGDDLIVSCLSPLFVERFGQTVKRIPIVETNFPSDNQHKFIADLYNSLNEIREELLCSA